MHMHVHVHVHVHVCACIYAAPACACACVYAYVHVHVHVHVCHVCDGRMIKMSVQAPHICICSHMDMGRACPCSSMTVPPTLGPACGVWLLTATRSPSK
jgi:hypothetical protein